jgi:hypothetical protein
MPYKEEEFPQSHEARQGTRGNEENIFNFRAVSSSIIPFTRNLFRPAFSSSFVS